MASDCDLALITVNDPAFFKNIKTYSFGDLPDAQEMVTVLGYPEGGEKLSITQGIVSRIEVVPYTQSGRNFLAAQIDAAINPGNSGGPVLLNGKIVGIVMQSYQRAQNIGYMIPTPIIEHFLKDLEDTRYDGFPLLGVDFTNTENPALREYLKMRNKNGGVMINSVLPFSPGENYLQPQDVVLEISGTPIGEDGTFNFNNRQRLELSYLISQKQMGENLPLKISRNGEVKELNIPLSPFRPLVPYPRFYTTPPYYIFGGLVFSVLSTDLLQSYGEKWWEQAPLNFTDYFIGSKRFNRERRKEIVVLLNVLPDNINAGYEDIHDSVIVAVNNKPVGSFQEFMDTVNSIAEAEPFIIFKTDENATIILRTENIKKINEDILKRNFISRAFSKDF